MTNFSNYIEQQLLGVTLLGSTYTAPATVYASLATTIASDGDFFTEVATNTGYARLGIDFSEPTSGPTWTAVNSADLLFSTSTTPWGTVVAFGIYDSATIGGGNLLYWGNLGSSQVVGTGQTIQILAGDLTVTLD